MTLLARLAAAAGLACVLATPALAQNSSTALNGQLNWGDVVADINVVTRDGARYTACDLRLFRKLKQKKAIASSGGGPYRVTRRGLQLVRSELDNR